MRADTSFTPSKKEILSRRGRLWCPLRHIAPSPAPAVPPPLRGKAFICKTPKKGSPSGESNRPRSVEGAKEGAPFLMRYPLRHLRCHLSQRERQLPQTLKRLSLWGEQSAKVEGERVEQEDTLKKELRNEKFGVLCVSDEKFPKKISQNPG